MEKPKQVPPQFFQKNSSSAFRKTNNSPKKEAQKDGTRSKAHDKNSSTALSTDIKQRLAIAVKTRDKAGMELVAQELQESGDYVSAYKVLHKANSTDKKQELAKKIASAILYMNGWPDMI